MAGPVKRTQRYLAALRSKWWIFLITLSLTLGAAGYHIKTLVPKFVSKSAMWVTGKLQMPDGARYTEDSGSFFGTQIELLQSGRMIERAYTRLKESNPKLELPKDELGRPVFPRISISQAPRSSVFTLESRSTNGPLAQMFLDALMEEFLAYKKEIRAATSGDALASVSTQIYKQEQDLKAEQSRLNEFQRSNNVALIQEQFSNGGSQLAQLQGQLSMTRLDFAMLDATAIEQTNGILRTNIFANAPDPRRLADSSGTASASLPTDFVSAYQQVQMLKVQREQLSRYLRPAHPKIVKLDDEIARSEKAIAFFRQQGTEQLENAKQALKLRIENLQNAIKEKQDIVAEANIKLADYQKIRDSIQRLQSFYDRLLILLQGVDINRNLDQENVAILERATAPAPADLPAVKTLIVAFALGVGAGVGLLFLIALLDDRFDSLTEIRDLFPEEILGQVPEVASKGKKTRPSLLGINDDRHMFAESFRNLRSSLLYRGVDDSRLKTIVVTSAVPNEGKSTVTANLARTMAFSGTRVLLIDGDLRAGSIHRLFDVPASPGLTDLIRAKNDVDHYIVPTDVPNLFLLPCGSECSDSGELLLSKSFDQVLATVKNKYEYVFIDSMPIFAADDTSSLAPKADAVLFVLRGGFTSAKLARNALELLYQRRVNVLGLIFNRANANRSDNYYYKYDKYYKVKAQVA